MALFIQEITEKNRRTDYLGAAANDTYLFNAERVGDFKEKPDGTVTFYYEGLADRRKPINEYKCSATGEEFHANIRGATGEKWVMIQVMYEWINNTWVAKGDFIRYNIDKHIEGWDLTVDGENGSELRFAKGAFEIGRYLTSHTIAEINSADSQSTSFSAS